MTGTKCLPVLLALALACSGCMVWTAPVQPPRGGLYTHYSAPLTPEISNVPVCAKSGEAQSMYVRDIILTGQSIAWDDASIQAAAEDGRLTKVHYADYEIMEVLGIVGIFTVTAYGE